LESFISIAVLGNRPNQSLLSPNLNPLKMRQRLDRKLRGKQRIKMGLMRSLKGNQIRQMSKTVNETGKVTRPVLRMKKKRSKTSHLLSFLSIQMNRVCHLMTRAQILIHNRARQSQVKMMTS